jgi:hypothetical protein
MDERGPAAIEHRAPPPTDRAPPWTWLMLVALLPACVVPFVPFGESRYETRLIESMFVSVWRQGHWWELVLLLPFSAFLLPWVMVPWIGWLALRGPGRRLLAFVMLLVAAIVLAGSLAWAALWMLGLQSLPQFTVAQRGIMVALVAFGVAVVLALLVRRARAEDIAWAALAAAYTINVGAVIVAMIRERGGVGIGLHLSVVGVLATLAHMALALRIASGSARGKVPRVAG